MNGPIAQRVLPRVDGPPDDVLARLAAAGTTAISDAVEHAFSIDSVVTPMYDPIPSFAGPAVTVSSLTGSLVARKEAIGLMRPGDVLVIDAHANPSYSVLGGNVAAQVVAAGGVGVVINGCARDVDEVRDLGLPVLCRGRAVGAGLRTGPGEVNVPVCVGGAVVRPGDVVVGDRDGAAVVPAELVLLVDERLATSTSQASVTSRR